MLQGWMSAFACTQQLSINESHLKHPFATGHSIFASFVLLVPTCPVIIEIN
jgi:hypothetical protein